MLNGYVHGLLDTDLYKITMQNAVCFTYPKAIVQYEFINRDNRKFPPGFGTELQKIINTFKGYTLKKHEKDFLQSKCYYLNPVYLDFLNGYQYDPTEVDIKQNDNQLIIRIQGKWYRTILWEVPLMATISQLYFEMTKPAFASILSIKENLTNIDKNKALEFEKMGIKFTDFGTRRRYSFDNHKRVLSNLIKYAPNTLIGTSNVLLAMENNLTPIGTQAHEFFSFMGAKYGFRMANEMAMEKWIEIYQGNLGIALPDTFTTDVFLRSFNTKYAKLFDGVRHDSSDPIKFTDKIIEHYKKLRINSASKTIVYSDNLNVEKIGQIHDYCKQKPIQDSYGIGTYLTNDIPYIKPLNIVIKMTGYYDNGWIPTIKLSDDIGKHTGDLETVQLCKRIITR